MALKLLAPIEPEPVDSPVLIVFSGGNNSRLGNMLETYIELRLVCEQVGRRLVFPFAEDVIGRFFSFDVPSGDTDAPNHSKSLYGRLLRSAEERLEEAEEVGAYKYTPDRVHKVVFDQIGLETLFHRGRIDWPAFVASGGLGGERPLLLKDPFPFNVSGGASDDILEAGRRFIAPRPEVFAVGARLKSRQCPRGSLDVVFHHRQGDFLDWQGGAYWYDDALMNRIVDRLHAHGAETGRKVHITIVSDEAPPRRLGRRTDVARQRGSLEEDFTRIACADIVISNSSTFSKLAELVGRTYLNNKSRYFSLGNRETALSQLESSLAEIC